MNYQLFQDINNLSGNSTVDALMKAAAAYLIFGCFAVLAVLCLLRLRQRQWRPIVATGVTLVLTLVLALIGSAVYSEKRPFVTHHVHQLVAHAADQSFPSDHATAAFGIALAVWAFLSWRWGVVLFLAAVLIGFARVYDGIHYPLDILGGLVAALVATVLVAIVERRFGHPRRRDYTRRRPGGLVRS